MDKCDIYLENYTNYYIAGQEIIGYLQCTFQTPKVVKGIKLKLKGEAKTEWSERESHYNSTTKKNELRTVHYYGHETYFSTEINLLRSNGDKITLAEGEHKYPFTYRLPENLPSTFTGTYGTVKYTVKGVVSRPLLSSNYEAESPFDVVALIDLNHRMHLKEPENVKKEKNLCFLWMNSGPINYELNVPFTGVAIGQGLPIYLCIENLANSSVEKVKYEIKQILTFTTTTPSTHIKVNESVIVQKELSGVGAHGERVYEDTLIIPANFSAPNLDYCSIIDIAYKLKVKAVLPCPHRNITTKIPIVIGHIPLRGTITNATETSASAPPSYDYITTQPAYNPNIGPQASGSVAPVYGFVLPESRNGLTSPEFNMPQVSAFPSNSAHDDDDDLADWVNVGSGSADTKATAPPPTYEEAVGFNK